MHHAPIDNHTCDLVGLLLSSNSILFTHIIRLMTSLQCFIHGSDWLCLSVHKLKAYNTWFVYQFVCL